MPTDAFRYARELGPLPFPTPGTVGHAAPLLCDAAALDGSLVPDRPGWRAFPEPTVVARLADWGQRFGAGRGGWAQEDVDDPAGLAEKVRTLLIGLNLLRVDVSIADEDAGGPQWWFSPATGRWRIDAGRSAEQDRGQRRDRRYSHTAVR